jgi:hypothetical protein
MGVVYKAEDTRLHRLEFIPEESAVFVAAAKQAKLRLRKSTALYIHGDDRPGAIADILGKLAGAHQRSRSAGSAWWRGKLRRNRVPAPDAAPKAATVLDAT